MSGVEALVLQAKLLWDGDTAEKGMNNAGKTAESMESKIGSAMKKIGGYIAAAFTIDAIKNFVNSTIEAGAEVAAETAAFEQIMGDYSDTAQTKMEEVANATGMVSSRLTPYMTSMTAKFKGLGYDIEDATGMATRGLTLAADAGAFWDMSLDESMGHLNSFINGSYEGGEAIGLFANDTQMAAYAVKQGIIKNTKAWANLDEATKQATRLEYAENMMELSGATGQAAKESDAYANVQANLAEKWRQFKAQIGEPIIDNIVIPSMKRASAMVDTLSSVFSDLTEFWADTFKPALQTVSDAFGRVKEALKKVLPEVNASIDGWELFRTLIAGPFEVACELLADALDAIAALIPPIAEAVTNFATGALQTIMDKFQDWRQYSDEVATALGIAAAAFAGFKVGSTIQSIVKGFQSAKLAVSLFTAQQGKAKIATALSTGALKAHEIIVGLLTGKITFAQIATALWTKAQTILNGVLTANPIGLIIMAVAALVAAFVIAYKKSDTFRNFVNNLWATLKEKLQPVLQAVGDFIQNKVVPAFQRMGEFIKTTVVPAIQELGTWLKDHILSAIQAVGDWISTQLIPTLQEWWNYIKTQIVPALQELGAAIQERVQPILNWLSDFITTTVIPIFQRLKDNASQIWQSMAPALEAAKTAWNTIWTNIKTVAQTVWSNIKTIVQTGLQVIKGIIQTVTAVIRGDWSGAWTTIKNTASTLWTGIKTVVSNSIQAAKTVISNTLSGIKSVWSNIWTAIKNTASTIWNAIKDLVTERIQKTQEQIKTNVEKIKNWMNFAGLKAKAEKVFKDTKDAIVKKVEDARDKIKDIIEKIKGFFTGAKFEWPDIPTPHFSISPKGWKIGDLLEGSIPKLSISWYARAMDEAAVLDGATIFGAAGGQLLGGGEAGREVVSGEAHLIGLINQAVAQNNAAMLEVLHNILDAIRMLDAGMYDQIVEALVDGVKMKWDNREFGRLVKAHA